MRMILAALFVTALLPLQIAGQAGAQLGQKDKPVGPPVQPVPPPAPTQAADEAALKAANIGSDGPALVDFFKKRVPQADAEATVNDLIKKLADKDEKVQQKAQGELVALGPVAVAALRQAANGVEDKAAASRASQCLQQIEGGPGANLVKAAVRVLALRKPDGAAGALLAYAPYAENETVTREIEIALPTVAVKDGKPDPALVKALEDKQPAVRALAADVLCQVGGPAERAKVRALLKDEKPTVRLRAALGLAATYDPEAVPVLIDSLGELQPAQLKQAEEVLTDIAGEYAIKTPDGTDAISKRLRRELWQAWWKAVDGKTLTDELRARTLSDADYEKAKGFIKDLAAADAPTRDKASTGLVALGPAALPLLRLVTAPPASVQAAANCVKLIEKDNPNRLPYSAPRLLVLHRADKALETLLNYLPFAESDTMGSQIIELLSSIGFTDGKPAPALLAALEDKAAPRRAAAVIALGESTWDDQKPTLRKLLKDADAEVRLRTAQTLIGLKEKDVVPDLINLFTDLPPELAWEAEELLVRMAGDKSPNVPFATDAAGRTKTRDAWAAWWKENSDKVELVKIDLKQRQLGYTLVVEGFSQVKNQGRITELDAAGKARWSIEGLNFPNDAQVLPGERVLVSEQNMNRVSERDRTGKILWEKQNLPQPFVAQRQRTGNTFIACRNALMEVDRTGKEVFTLHRNEYLMAATKLRNGEIAIVSNVGNYTRLDSTGKELKTFHVQPPQGINYVEVLPNDRVLVVTQNSSKLIEYDADGKQVWEAGVNLICGQPTRLQNGHTLVPSNGPSRIVELDRAGKVVWELKDTNYRVLRVSRR